MRCLVLDAMGVIFAAADDVAELLIPFVTEHAGTTDEVTIQEAYLDASLGEISADEFWIRVGLAPELEDDYLAQHSLNPGVMDLLSQARLAGIPIWCLSNDLGRWSQKLRERLGVEEYLQQSIISGEVGIRKPDAAIYRVLISTSGYALNDFLFVDDRANNVSAAYELGIESILFDSLAGFNEVQSRLTSQ